MPISQFQVKNKETQCVKQLVKLENNNTIQMNIYIYVNVSALLGRPGTMFKKWLTIP